MKPYTPAARLVVRDSLEDDYSDDVEDDVFIRDGKSKHAREENGLKRPLMAPRRGGGSTGGYIPGHSQNRKAASSSAPVSELLHRQRRTRCWRCCEPFCYGCLALSAIIGVIVFISVLMTMFPMPLQRLQVWVNNHTSATPSIANNSSTLAGINVGSGLFFGEETPCTLIRSRTVWSSTFARLNSESPVRKIDVNRDGVLDMVFGFGLDDSFEYDEASVPRCDGGNADGFCEGGVLALDGRTGAELWRRWTTFNVFSLFCTADLNSDGRLDCVAAGRGGLVIAIDGRNGSVLWQLEDEVDSFASPLLVSKGDANAEPIIDLYTVNAIRDLNQDDCIDIVAVHVEERDSARTGHIKLISGREGRRLRSLPSPFDEEVFVPVQQFTQFDGTECLLITTGGQNSPGGLYLLRVSQLADVSVNGAGSNNAPPLSATNGFAVIYRQAASGFMVPPVLSDVNGDGTEDIVVAAFNATVRAFDGRSFVQLWSHTFGASETVSSLVPGHYNNDNVTDFMVKYNAGPGFPVYYYSQTQILDGASGKPLLDAAVLDAGGPYSLLAGLPVAQTLGGDNFLHWQTQCGKIEPSSAAYKFVPDSDVVQQSRADTCRLRHNESTILNLHMLSRHIQSPGPVIFSTDSMQVQLKQSTLSATIYDRASVKHPKMTKAIVANKELVQRSENNQVIENNNEQIDDNSVGGNMMIDNSAPIYEGGALSQLDQSQQQQLRAQQQAYTGGPRSRKVLDADSAITNVNSNGGSNSAGTAGDYESYFNFDQEGRIPIAMRTRYRAPAARDVRSKTNRRNGVSGRPSGAVESSVNDSTSTLATNEQYDPVDQVPMPVMPPITKTDPERPHEYGAPRVEHRNTLWDLEIEREMNEAKKTHSGADVDFQSKTGVRRRRRRVQNLSGGAFMQDYLPSVASTGVLVPSLPLPTITSNTDSENSRNSSCVDFVFVLNVRESETMPPLLLPDDLACVEQKLALERQTFGNFAPIKLRMLEEKFLRLCLLARLVDSATTTTTQHSARFESQIVVTRLSITCGCDDVPLKDGEVCARLKPFGNNDGAGDRSFQRWTGFMGDSANGVY